MKKQISEGLQQLQAIDDYDNCMGMVGEPEIGMGELIEIVLENEEILACLDNIAKQRLGPEVEKVFYIPDDEYHKKERVIRLLQETGGIPQEVYGMGV